MNSLCFLDAFFMDFMLQEKFKEIQIAFWSTY